MSDHGCRGRLRHNKLAGSCPPVREEGIVISIISSKMQKERDTFENYCVSGEGAGQQLRLGTSFFVAVTVSEFITEAGGEGHARGGSCTLVFSRSHGSFHFHFGQEHLGLDRNIICCSKTHDEEALQAECKRGKPKIARH